MKRFLLVLHSLPVVLVLLGPVAYAGLMPRSTTPLAPIICLPARVNLSPDVAGIDGQRQGEPRRKSMATNGNYLTSPLALEGDGQPKRLELNLPANRHCPWSSAACCRSLTITSGDTKARSPSTTSPTSPTDP
jgi:hypothetical protein